MYNLGLRLKEIRKCRKLTQKELARRINKSTAAISSYESGAQMPPLDVLISIATTLHISLDNLVGFDNESSYSGRALTEDQKHLLNLQFVEFSHPTNSGRRLSHQQVQIIQEIILVITNQK